MSSVKKPPGGTRREKARATRRAIVRAAREEFEGAGYHATTMAGIARRAGVAVQTVYFVFNTKAELLGACIDDAVLGTADPVPPDETLWWVAAESAPDARTALREFVAGTAEVLARASAMAEVARIAAQTDADAERTHVVHEAMRREGYARMVETVSSKGSLRPGLDAARATDVLLTVLGPGTFASMTRERGWSAERVTAWLVDCVPDVILDPAG